MTNDAAVAIKRYAPNLGIGDTFVCMQPEIRGRWVEYGDHVDVVAELRARVEAAERRVAELRAALEGVMYWDNGKSEWAEARAALTKETP